MVSSSITGEMKQQYDLHSVHRSSNQRILKKPLNSLAPLASGPQQPKVYKVKPIHFRELVQKLTGAPLNQLQNHQSQSQPQPQPRRRSLQSVAPPPLPLHPHQLRMQSQSQTSFVKQEVAPYKVEQAPLPASSAAVEQKSFMDKMEDGDGLTELTLSPNFQSWFAFAMLSPAPATVSQLEQRSVV